MTASNPSPSLERDPVCGMSVNPATAKHVYEQAGKNYYFCCASCAEKFRADSAKYLSQPAGAPPGLVMIGMPSATKASPAGPPLSSLNTESSMRASETKAEASGHEAGLVSPAYVCPMCPDVRESKPIACPSCGMALELETPIGATRTDYTCP